ncbi:hypothetical protein SAMN05421693_11426 [Ectothiorhodospira magna]|uniref:Uncharacterized protein n=1 Tax=Ectothiorhodospira magna TaxID=867345 RepID=A0A1H9CJS9_9GAMM|nr:hypothetical protein [Ectothiorhodospira magna]SEQ01470.1 hypothetical protein SAMN05421693_11426 [Ectothiorhodospira magna]
MAPALKYLNIDAACRQADLKPDLIEQALIAGELRAGIFARGWRGRWWPRVQGEYARWGDHSDFTRDGRKVISHRFARYPFAVHLADCHQIAQFWYLDHAHVYKLLAMRLTHECVTFIHRGDLPDAVDWRTDEGVMVLYDDQEHPREITRADLLIPVADLEHWLGGHAEEATHADFPGLDAGKGLIRDAIAAAIQAHQQERNNTPTDDQIWRRIRAGKVPGHNTGPADSQLRGDGSKQQCVMVDGEAVTREAFKKRMNGYRGR